MTENKIKLQTHKKTFTKLQIKRKEIQNKEEKLVSNHRKHDEYITKKNWKLCFFVLTFLITKTSSYHPQIQILN
jgi:hypothetical protein